MESSVYWYELQRSADGETWTTVLAGAEADALLDRMDEAGQKRPDLNHRVIETLKRRSVIARVVADG